MLKVKLGKALAFLDQTDIDYHQAFDELFEGINPNQLDIPQETLSGLANEWLLFDYKPAGKQSLIEQYYFSNPDNLEKPELKELRQIIENQSFHLFQTYAKSQPPFIFLQSVFTGKKFKVYDFTLSLSIDELNGSFLGRLAKVGKTSYLVGSSPLTFPIRHTQRAIDIFVQEKTPVPSLKKAIQQLSRTQRPVRSKVDLRSERRKLKKTYTQLAKKFGSSVTFKIITDFVYEENYQHHFADYITDLIKLGIPELMCIEHIDYFQEIWNYFPHKSLSGKCPHELYQEEYFEKKD